MGDNGAGGRSGDTGAPVHRVIALVGPQGTGKTSLLEAVLERSGVIGRAGKVADGTTVGDSSAEARAHQMSVELNLAEIEFMGDRYTFVNCPGSIEFLQDMRGALPAVDAAIVVCEADDKKVPAMRIIMRELEDRGIPHFLFVNKIDRAEISIQDTIALLQPSSASPLVMRQLPIFENGIATGFIDLALERAFVYREHAPSEVVPLDGDTKSAELEARFSMLEQLADFDDTLMEQLLSDIEPPRDLVFDDLSKDLAEGLIVPVLVGSAENGNGILRLLKALRHEAPTVTDTAARLGLEGGDFTGYVMKTLHTSHAGKLSLTRVLTGKIVDGTSVSRCDEEIRISGMVALSGAQMKKAGEGSAGQLVGLAKLDDVSTGDLLSAGKAPDALIDVTPPQPVMGRAVSASERKDEVKLTTSIHKLIDEDPSLTFTQSPETGEMALRGQGEMHLRVAFERLGDKWGVGVESRIERIGYKETIRKPATVRGRHKKQTGGHGQFGDILIDIKPLPRGSGFEFSDTITGGVVPKNYIPAVEAGVRDILNDGPLGFPVVDLSVVLTDGSYHSVDSSDQAFRTAGHIAMREGLPQCSPVLLEPILAVDITVPSEATPKVNSIVSARRGQLLGYDARPGWEGWDVVNSLMPESEIQDLIVELRSVTLGVGSFTTRFDHWQELTGRIADQVIEAAA